MKIKIVTFKPCKNGDVTLYLGQGINLKELVDLIGQEVEITPAKQEESKEENALDIDIENVLKAVRIYGEKQYQKGQDIQISSDEKTKEIIDIFEFGEGK